MSDRLGDHCLPEERPFLLRTRGPEVSASCGFTDTTFGVCDRQNNRHSMYPLSFVRIKPGIGNAHPRRYAWSERFQLAPTDCPPFLWSIEMSEPTNMANMFWNLDKISETTAIHSGFRLCPIISHSSIRRTIPVAFIYKLLLRL